MSSMNGSSCLVTLSQYIDHYLYHYLVEDKPLSKYTIHCYEVVLKDLLNFFADENKPEDVTVECLTADKVCCYLTMLAEQHASACTLNQRLSCIKSFAKYIHLCRPEFCDDLLHKIPRFHANSNQSRVVTQEQLAFMLEKFPRRTITDRKYFTILHLLLSTGLRVKELTMLSPGDIECKKTMNVLLRNKNGERKIPVPLYPRLVMMHYMSEHDLTIPENSHQPLFPNKDGNTMTTSGLNFMINKYLEDLRKDYPDQLPKKLSPSDFRKVCGMRWAKEGVTLYRQRELMGHVSLQTTMAYRQEKEEGSDAK